MLTAGKWLLITSGVLLILDSIMMFAGLPNPLFGWPLPCPVTLALLGAGLVLSGAGSRSRKKQ